MNAQSSRPWDTHRRTEAGQSAGATAAAPVESLVYIGVGLSGTAAVLHAWVVPEHLAVLPAAGVVFLVAAFLQGAYAAALLDRLHSSWLVALGLAGNLALLLLWLAVHVGGLESSSLSAHHHAAGAAHLEATAIAGLALEFTLVMALAALLTDRYLASKRPVICA